MKALCSHGNREILIQNLNHTFSVRLEQKLNSSGPKETLMNRIGSTILSLPSKPKVCQEDSSEEDGKHKGNNIIHCVLVVIGFQPPKLNPKVNQK